MWIFLQSALSHFESDFFMQTDKRTAQYLPQRVLLLGKHVEIVDPQLQRGHRDQSQVGPALKELHHPFKCVQRYTVVAVVVHVGHEDVELHST